MLPFGHSLRSANQAARAQGFESSDFSAYTHANVKESEMSGDEIRGQRALPLCACTVLYRPNGRSISRKRRTAVRRGGGRGKTICRPRISPTVRSSVGQTVGRSFVSVYTNSVYRPRSCGTFLRVFFLFFFFFFPRGGGLSLSLSLFSYVARATEVKRVPAGCGKTISF